jgi:hypothetical protein
MSETEAKKPFRLHPSDFCPDASQMVRHSAIMIPAGVPIEATNEPEFWSMFSRQIIRNQYIFVDTKDNAYCALLKVRAILDSGARTEIVWCHVPTTASPPQQDAYSVKWAGNTHKFRVVRLSDGEVIKYGFETKEDAEKYVFELTRQIAA